MVIENGATIPVLVGAAVIDSINPCAFGVLIFILAYLIKISKQKIRVVVDGFSYVVGVYLTYLGLGILVFLLLTQILSWLRETSLVVYFYQAMGLIIILFGLLELKETFIPEGVGPRLAIMPAWAAKIKQWVAILGRLQSGNIFLGAGFAMIMGFLVALVELPCTGAPYLAVITILQQKGLTLAQTIPFLLIYNIIFVLPLLIIIFFVYRGSKTKMLMDWKNEHKWLMRLGTGLLLIGLGVFIFFFDFFFGG